MPAKKKSTIKKTKRTSSTARKKGPSKKKTAKKKIAKKKAIKKKSAARASGAWPRKTARKGTRASVPKKEPLLIEPGPPGLTVPPVEEPPASEEAIGTVTHYYSHLGVAIVQINKGILRSGDTVRIKGHTTDLVQTIDSMEYEHAHIEEASAGQSVGIKVIDHARQHDILYRLR